MATVILPTSLTKFTGGQREINVDANNIPAALRDVQSMFPSLRDSLLMSNNQIPRFVRLSLNNSLISHLAPNESSPRLSDGDILNVIMAVSGG